MSKTKWNRWRFCTRSEDFRPIVFNPSYPWWCSGEGEDEQGGFAVVVAFLPTTEKLETYWDDAFDIDVQEHDAVTFSERFARPKYYVELVEDAEP